MREKKISIYTHKIYRIILGNGKCYKEHKTGWMKNSDGRDDKERGYFHFRWRRGLQLKGEMVGLEW